MGIPLWTCQLVPFIIVKFLVSALIVTIASEVAKRSGWMGGLIASIPLVSVLSFLSVYFETKDIEKISTMSWGILVYHLPSFTLFIALPLLLKRGVSFYPAFGISLLITISAYGLHTLALKKLGMQF
jgi:hypothetical protein